MIENSKANWVNGLISSVVVVFGGFMIATMNKVKFENYLVTTPFLILMTFSPVLGVELINKIQNRKNAK